MFDFISKKDTHSPLARNYLYYEFDLGTNREKIEGSYWELLSSNDKGLHWRDICSKRDLNVFDEEIPKLLNDPASTFQLQIELSPHSELSRIFEFDFTYQEKDKKVVGFGRDITKVMKKEEKLEGFEELFSVTAQKDQTLFGLANPLTVLNLSLKQLEPALESHFEMKEVFERIDRSLSNMKQTLEELVENRSIKESGQTDLEKLFEEFKANYPELQQVIIDESIESVKSSFWILYFSLEKIFKIFKRRRIVPFIRVRKVETKIHIEIDENLTQAGFHDKSSSTSINYGFLKSEEKKLFYLAELYLKKTYGSLLLISTNPFSLRFELPID